MPPVLEITPSGLYCSAGDFYVDPWQPVRRAVITHAHADHVVPGCDSYLTADPGVALLRERLRKENTVEGGYVKCVV